MGLMQAQLSDSGTDVSRPEMCALILCLYSGTLKMCRVVVYVMCVTMCLMKESRWERKNGKSTKVVSKKDSSISTNIYICKSLNYTFQKV